MKLRDFIKEKIGEYCEVSVINDQSMLKKHLMLSSLDYVRLIIDLEDEYQTELPEELQVLDQDKSLEQFVKEIEDFLEQEKRSLKTK